MKASLCALFGILLMLSGAARAVVGDPVFAISTSGINGHFTVDQANSRFIEAGSTGIRFYGFDGLFIKAVGLEGGQFTSSVFSRGIARVDALRIAGLNSNNQVSIWTLVTDMGGNEEFVQESIADLSALGSVNFFGVAPDGSLWLIVDGTVQHLGADWSTVLASRPLTTPYIGVSLGAFGHFVNLTVETSSGRPVLAASGNFSDAMGGFATASAGYYLNPNDAEPLARFRWPLDGLAFEDRIAASNGVVYVLRPSEDTLTGYELADALPPAMSNLDSVYSGLFWRHCERTQSSAPFNPGLGLTVDVDWAGGAGGVFFGGGPLPSTITVSTPGIISGNSVAFDYGLRDNDLFNALPGSTRPSAYLEVINDTGQSSGAVPVELAYEASYAEGVGAGLDSQDACSRYGFSSSQALGSGTVGKWSLAQRAPPAPLDLLIEFDANAPFLAGKSFGIEGFQMEFEANMVGQMQDQVTMSGGGAIKVGTGQLTFKAGLGATTELSPETVTYDKGLFAFQIGGLVKVEQPLLELIPALAALANAPLIGRVLEVVTDAAKAVAEIGLTLDTKLTAGFPQTNGVASFCIEGAVEPAATLKTGIVIELLEGLAELSVLGGGTGKVSFQSVPAQCPSLDFNEIVLQVFLSGRYVLFGATAAIEVIKQIKYPFPTAGKSETAQTPPQWSYTWPGNLRPADKSAPSPVVVTANPFAATAGILNAKGGGAQPTVQSTVLSGIGRDARPQSAMAPDGRTLVVWMQERTDLPPTQATDLFYSYFDGSSFSSPQAIASDTQADLQPVVAWHRSGHFIVGWLKVRDPNLLASGDPQADALAQSRLLRPWHARFNAATQSWSAPAEIPSTVSTDDSSSYLMRVATGPTHEVALLWLTNPNGDLVPYSVQQQTIMSDSFVNWAAFDDAGIGASGVVRQGSRVQFVAMNLSGAYTSDELLIGFNEPFGTFQVIFFVFRTPTPLNNFSFFTRPGEATVFPQGGGQKVMALGDGRVAVAAATRKSVSLSLYGDTDDWVGTRSFQALYEDRAIPTDFTTASGGFLDSFQLGESGAGEVFAVVPEIRDGHPDFLLGLGDANAAPAGGEGLFNGGAVLEKSMNVSTAADGDVLLMYYQADLAESTVTRDLGDGPLEFERTEEPTSGRIVLARHRINTDLTARDVTLVVALSEAGQMATATATVINSGDRAVLNPTISLFARPIGGAVTKGASADIAIVENLLAVDGWFAAGDSVTVSVPWTLPANSRYVLYAVVDPANAVAEFNEGDNQQPPANALDLVFGNGFEVN